jgi:hypothetical protein
VRALWVALIHNGNTVLVLCQANSWHIEGQTPNYLAGAAGLPGAKIAPTGLGSGKGGYCRGWGEHTAKRWLAGTTYGSAGLANKGPIV